MVFYMFIYTYIYHIYMPVHIGKRGLLPLSKAFKSWIYVVFVCVCTYRTVTYHYSIRMHVHTGKRGFLPVSKAFKSWSLPSGSWLRVVAVQKTRVKVESDYEDTDEGILSLKRGESATASGEVANGWAQLRADSGKEVLNLLALLVQKHTN